MNIYFNGESLIDYRLKLKINLYTSDIIKADNHLPAKSTQLGVCHVINGLEDTRGCDSLTVPFIDTYNRNYWINGFGWGRTRYLRSVSNCDTFTTLNERRAPVVSELDRFGE